MILPDHITSLGRFGNVNVQACFDTLAASNVGWPAANRALYVPVIIPEAFTIARFFSANASVTGNDDVGIYSSAGTLLLSTGSQARTNACNYYDVADTNFAAGFYYLAESHNNTGQHYSIALGVAPTRIAGVLEESNFPLPASMTGVAATASYIPLIGFTQSGSF